MLQTIRQATARPPVSARWAVPALTASGFLWLLAHDAIEPVAIVLLQLYLAF